MKKALAYLVAFAFIMSLTPVVQAQTVQPPVVQSPPVGTMPPGGPQWHHGDHHPEIHHAIHALEKAKEDLLNAAHDYAGHRTQAIEAIDAALGQLHAALLVNE